MKNWFKKYNFNPSVFFIYFQISSSPLWLTETNTKKNKTTCRRQHKIKKRHKLKKMSDENRFRKQVKCRNAIHIRWKNDIFVTKNSNENEFRKHVKMSVSRYDGPKQIIAFFLNFFLKTARNLPPSPIKSLFLYIFFSIISSVV